MIAVVAHEVYTWKVQLVVANGAARNMEYARLVRV
jgi:hypothetical protein